MKKLTLIRHGQSSQGTPLLSDFDRPLNERGLDEATRMGCLLKEQLYDFDQAFSSPALRAITTAQHVTTELAHLNLNLRSDPALYTFDMEDLFHFIEVLDDAFQSVVIFGHNPAITLLANDLTLSSITNVPTCGVIAMEFDIKNWIDVQYGQGTLTAFEYPEKLQSLQQ